MFGSGLVRLIVCTEPTVPMTNRTRASGVPAGNGCAFPEGNPVLIAVSTSRSVTSGEPLASFFVSPARSLTVLTV